MLIQSHRHISHYSTLSYRHEDDRLKQPQVQPPGWLVLPDDFSSFDNDGTSWNKLAKESAEEKASSTEINTKILQMKGSGYSPPFNDYIRLIRDQKKKIWICDSCVNSSLSLNNDSVKISTTGLYHIHAQVVFSRPLQSKPPMKDAATVTLVKIQGLATKIRKLSEVMRYEPGTSTMIRLVSLKEGDSIRLDISPDSLRLSNEECHTYWEILLYNKNV